MKHDNVKLEEGSIFILFNVYFSSDPREAVGDRSPVFPDHYDENWTHQTRRVHGLPQEVTAAAKPPIKTVRVTGSNPAHSQQVHCYNPSDFSPV